MRTFWLYWGTRVLTAVRMPAGATPQEVRDEAVRREGRLPLCHDIGREAPFEFCNRLRRAEVRL